VSELSQARDRPFPFREQRELNWLGDERVDDQAQHWTRKSLFNDVSLPALIAAQEAESSERKRDKVPAAPSRWKYPPTIADLLDGLGEMHAEAGAGRSLRLKRRGVK
jgi:hypothetical protein